MTDEIFYLILGITIVLLGIFILILKIFEENKNDYPFGKAAYFQLIVLSITLVVCGLIMIFKNV